MLRYDWQKIFETSGKNATEIFKIFKMLTNKEIPWNTYDPMYKYSLVDFNGNSFLLHPDVLLYNAYQYTHRDISIYLALASLRPVAKYLSDRTITLPLLHAPIDPRKHLEDLSLVPVKGDTIHFPYETTGTIH